MAFYKVSEKVLKKTFAAATKERTRLSLLVNDIRAKVVDLRERSDANVGVVLSIVEDSCKLLGPCLRSLVENFRTGLNKPVNEAVRAYSIGSQFHADVAIVGTTLRYLEGTASDNGGSYATGEDVFDLQVDPEVIYL